MQNYYTKVFYNLDHVIYIFKIMILLNYI